MQSEPRVITSPSSLPTTTALHIIPLVTLILGLVGITIAFLWIQVELPHTAHTDRWDARIQVYPSFYAFWIPGIYLFFTGVWLYLLRRSPTRKLYFFLRLDYFTYPAVLIFFLLQINWRLFHAPEVWFRVFVLILLLLKSLFLFRALYQQHHLIQPMFLVALSSCLYLFTFPFAHTPLVFAISDLFQHAVLLRLGILSVKAVALSLLGLELFSLSMEMAKSERSAFFSWVIVMFTFPALGFPKIFYIAFGLLITFVLRMVFSRLDTKELMLGLLTPESITIVFKTLLVLAILGGSGIVYWINVKPGFSIHPGRALQTAIGTLFDSQSGVLCYAPLYWLAIFGIVYLLFFKVWNGMLLLITGTVLYVGYHVAMFGMLERTVSQNDIVPFLSILGVFIAIAHCRFGQMVVFRYCARFLVMMTLLLTALLMVLHPNFISIASQVGEIQRGVSHSLGRDMTAIAPSTIFQPYSWNLVLWLAVFTGIAVICCYYRTRSLYPFMKRIQTWLEEHSHFKEFTFSPSLLLLLLLIGGTIVTLVYRQTPVPLAMPLALSRTQVQQQLDFSYELSFTPAQGVLIASSITEGLALPYEHSLANVVIEGKNQQFESFSLRVGKDTSDALLDDTRKAADVNHGRAAVYRTWLTNREDGVAIETHEYYTKFMLHKPLSIQQITFKLLDANDPSFSSLTKLHIKDIILLE